MPAPAAAIIVQDLAGQFWRVREDEPADHCWMGIAVKRTAAGFVPKAKAREILVRRFGCKLVEAV